MYKNYENKLINLYNKNKKIKNGRRFSLVFKRLYNNFKKYGIKYLFVVIKNFIFKVFEKISIVRRGLQFIKYKLYIYSYLKEIMKVIKKNYSKERLIIWYSEVGWDIPLFQRPQHIVRTLARNHNSLIFYTSAAHVDGSDFLIKKLENDLYLINLFGSRYYRFILKYISKRFRNKKYIYIASTSMIHDTSKLKNYEKMGYKIIYDYIDDLNPAISLTEKLHENIIDTYNYVMQNKDILVICTANKLIEDSIHKRGSEENIIFACNGVDFKHFTELNDNVELSDDYKEILANKKPIIGYYGAIASWFDYKLIEETAKELKDYNFVLIGPDYDKTIYESNLHNIKNIFVLGPRKFDDLPYYAKHFDVCILPFLINDVTNATNPIKIFEYMALKKPIITSDLPECRKYQSCLIYKNKDDFIKLIKENLKEPTDKYKDILLKEALENTWDAKGDIIIDKIKDMEKNNG